MVEQEQYRTAGRSAVAITMLAVVLGIAIPTALAITLSAWRGRDDELRLMSSYARGVLHRSEAASDQVFAAVAALQAADSGPPCSDSSLAVMRRFDLSSNYLQAVGYVANGRMVCSSQGREGIDFVLGPVDWVTPNGVSIRTNVRFPFDADHTYLVAERGGYAAVVNQDLNLDASVSEPDLSLGLFAPYNGRMMATRGFIDPKWVARLSPGLPRQPGVLTFVARGHVVAVARSSRYFIAGVAALPVSYMWAPAWSTARILLPVGLLAGIALAWIMLRLLRQQAALPALLRAALKRNEFFMVYQPVVDLRTGRWVGAEALIRWRRADGAMIRPDLFIPAAEDGGLIPEITRRVVELLTRDLADLLRREPDFHIALNLSSKDLEAADTIELLHRLAADTGAAPGSLIVEVTERAFLRRDLAMKAFHELRTDGIRVAIDDFGTGYSSLAYLENFEVDYLKIDKAFVNTMNLDTPTSQVALHIIEMAKSLNLTMIAEGVETQMQADFLRSLGVQYAQGWLFNRPLPMKELVLRLEQARRGVPKGLLAAVG